MLNSLAAQGSSSEEHDQNKGFGWLGLEGFLSLKYKPTHAVDFIKAPSLCAASFTSSARPCVCLPPLWLWAFASQHNRVEIRKVCLAFQASFLIGHKHFLMNSSSLALEQRCCRDGSCLLQDLSLTSRSQWTLQAKPGACHGAA